MISQNIDLHLIDLKYAHTSILDKKSIFSTMRSIDQYGQLTPVNVIPNSSRYILIDGHLRVKALARMGRDTVWAIVMDTDEHTALIQSLTREQHRPCNPLEEAGVIHELHINFKLSLARIARELGKDKSWVKRRLDLLQSLPENILELVRAGHISVWSASRIFAPLARANAEHAAKLAEYIVTHCLSNRELHEFFQEYKKSPGKIREKMVDNPELFLKLKKHREQSNSLQGPEEDWKQKMKQVCAILSSVHACNETVFTCLAEEEYFQFQRTLEQAETLLEQINSKASEGRKHALTTTTRNNKADAPKANRYKKDIGNSGSKSQYGAQSNQGV